MTIFWLIPEVITIILVLFVFIGMWREEIFTWHFVGLFAGVISMGYDTYKNIKELLAEDKQYQQKSK